MSEEKLYTLSEARQVIASQYCLQHGHTLVENWADTACVLIFCEVCGSRWVPKET